MNDKVKEFKNLFEKAYKNIKEIGITTIFPISSYSFDSKKFLGIDEILLNGISFSLVKLYFINLRDGKNCEDMLSYMKSIEEYIKPYEVICRSWEDFIKTDASYAFQRLSFISYSYNNVNDAFKGINFNPYIDIDEFINNIKSLFLYYTDGDDKNFKNCFVIGNFDRLNDSKTRNIVTCIKEVYNNFVIIGKYLNYFEGVYTENKVIDYLRISLTLYLANKYIKNGSIYKEKYNNVCNGIGTSYVLKIFNDLGYNIDKVEDIINYYSNTDLNRFDKALDTSSTLLCDYLFEHYSRMIGEVEFRCVVSNLRNGLLSIIKYFCKELDTDCIILKKFDTYYGLYKEEIIPWINKINNDIDKIDVSNEKVDYSVIDLILNDSIEECQDLLYYSDYDSTVGRDNNSLSSMLLLERTVAEELLTYSLIEVCMRDHKISNYDLKVLKEAASLKIDDLLKRANISIDLDECVKNNKYSELDKAFKKLKDYINDEYNSVTLSDYKKILSDKMISDFVFIKDMIIKSYHSILGVEKMHVNDLFLNTSIIKFINEMIKK